MRFDSDFWLFLQKLWISSVRGLPDRSGFKALISWLNPPARVAATWPATPAPRATKIAFAVHNERKRPAGLPTWRRLSRQGQY